MKSPGIKPGANPNPPRNTLVPDATKPQHIEFTPFNPGNEGSALKPTYVIFTSPDGNLNHTGTPIQLGN